MRKLRGLAFGYTQAPVPVTTRHCCSLTVASTMHWRCCNWLYISWNPFALPAISSGSITTVNVNDWAGQKYVDSGRL